MALAGGPEAVISAKRWWDHLQTYGSRRKNGSTRQEPYPKSAPLACRRDAWPEEGGRPGSSLALMQSQHLDGNSIEFGILGPLGTTGQGDFNLDFSAAMCSAVNDWQRETFTRPEKRLKGGIVVPYEDTAASVAEIDRCGADPDFAQVFMLTRSQEPLGNRRYWPIYEAARALQSAGRLPRVRHQRASGVGRGLAELLHRGRRGAFDVVPDGRFQPRHRGRVRALPGAEGGDGRRRLRLAAGAVVAARQAVRAHARTRFRT